MQPDRREVLPLRDPAVSAPCKDNLFWATSMLYPPAAQSFHFSPRLPGKDWGASEAAHEARLAALLQLGPGKKCLDVGCGVGGPMRTIASTSGAHVTGITINDYQVSRATYHNQRVRAAGAFHLLLPANRPCNVAKLCMRARRDVLPACM